MFKVNVTFRAMLRLKTTSRQILSSLIPPQYPISYHSITLKTHNMLENSFKLPPSRIPCRHLFWEGRMVIQLCGLHPCQLVPVL